MLGSCRACFGSWGHRPGVPGTLKGVVAYSFDGLDPLCLIVLHIHHAYTAGQTIWPVSLIGQTNVAVQHTSTLVH